MEEEEIEKREKKKHEATWKLGNQLLLLAGMVALEKKTIDYWRCYSVLFFLVVHGDPAMHLVLVRSMYCILFTKVRIIPVAVRSTECSMDHGRNG